MEIDKVKAVIFDMDGLMLDTEKIYYKANQETADRLELDFTYDFYEQFIGSNHLDFFKAMVDKYGEDKGKQFIEESEALLEDLLINGPVDMKSGLVELLDYLNQENIPAAVASSSPYELVDQLLKNANIRHYFIDIIGGDMVEKSKPNPEIFRRAKDFFPTQLEETLVLEDSLNGIRAAYTADLPVILVPDLFQPTDEAKEKANKVCLDLFEVRDFIKSIN